MALVASLVCLSTEGRAHHMRILVTGAAGFIGFHTAARLLDRGDEVVGLDNMSPYYDVSLKEARLDRLKGRNGFNFIKADLAEREVVEAVFAEERPERVIHLAAQAGHRKPEEMGVGMRHQLVRLLGRAVKAHRMIDIVAHLEGQLAVGTINRA